MTIRLKNIFHYSTSWVVLAPSMQWRWEGWHFWQKIEKIESFTNLFRSNCQSFCKFLLKYTPAILWKIKPEFGKLHKRVIFRVNFWKFYPSLNIFYTSATCDKFHVWVIRAWYQTMNTCASLNRNQILPILTSAFNEIYHTVQLSLSYNWLCSFSFCIHVN